MSGRKVILVVFDEGVRDFAILILIKAQVVVMSNCDLSYLTCTQI